jgi:hypothetical protein
VTSAERQDGGESGGIGLSPRRSCADLPLAWCRTNASLPGCERGASPRIAAAGGVREYPAGGLRGPLSPATAPDHAPPVACSRQGRGRRKCSKAHPQRYCVLSRLGFECNLDVPWEVLDVARQTGHVMHGEAEPLGRLAGAGPNEAEGARSGHAELATDPGAGL